MTSVNKQANGFSGAELNLLLDEKKKADATKSATNNKAEVKRKVPIIVKERITIISLLRVSPKVPRGHAAGWRNTHTTFGRTNKCAHCPNLQPLWMVNAFIQGALVDSSFGKMAKKNFYKTLMLCHTCKDKFVRLAAEREIDAIAQCNNPIAKSNDNNPTLALKSQSTPRQINRRSV